ncbi:response regulator [bacterium]|nr:response regulator [bacterium]
MDKPIHVLIVDDEEKFLAAIAKRLSMRGFEVVTAPNGEEALAKTDEQQFDLALVDLKMPGIDGRELLRLLKERHKFLEVIILTGHGSLDSAVDCTKLGAFGYLPKPYELDKLIEVLKDAYQERMKKKFEHDRGRMQKIMESAVGESALGILRKLRELDDDEK